MAFFKFRLPGQSGAEAQGNFSNPPTESVEALRRRARHRLIGASVLVVVGVIGFPLLFDTQPRPVSADISVDIPDRASKAVAAGATTPPAPALPTAATLDPKEEVVSKSTPEPKAEPAKPEAAKPEPSAPVASAKNEAPVSAIKPAEPTPPANAVAAKAPDNKDNKADAKAPPAKPDENANAARFVVQVGAFTEDAKVREVRGKVEKGGMKTYTQVAETKEGKRIRVRVGPFGSRDEADKAAAKIKQLGLQPQVLTL